MESREVTRELRRAAEIESGFPAHMREEPGLQTMAAVRRLTTVTPTHVNGRAALAEALVAVRRPTKSPRAGAQTVI